MKQHFYGFVLIASLGCSALLCTGCIAGQLVSNSLENGCGLLGGTPRERIAMVGEMAMEKRPENIPALLAELHDSEPLARRHAIYGLERLGDSKSAAAIIPLLHDSDSGVRRNAAIALGKLGSRDAVQPLVGCLADNDMVVRYEVITAICRIGDPSSQDAILTAFQDRRLWTGKEVTVWGRVDLLHLLDRSFITTTAAVSVLKDVLHHDQWPHPEFCDRIAENQTLFCLLPSHAAALILAEKFDDLSGEDYLIRGLSHADYVPMQIASAKTLGMLKSRKAVPELAKMLATAEFDDAKRRAAEALGKIGARDESARAALIKLLADKSISLRAIAAQSLTQMGEPFPTTDLAAPEAREPQIPIKQLATPGGKHPPQLISIAFDDCANIDGLEVILDFCETLRDRGSKVVFTLFAAPLASGYEQRDMEKQKLIYQRLFDLGCEFENHTLHHSPGGRFWTSLPKERKR